MKTNPLAQCIDYTHSIQVSTHGIHLRMVILLKKTMPFITKSTMSQKLEFLCISSLSRNQNMSDLCRRFNITRRAGYKWLRAIFGREIVTGLTNRSRQPLHSPNKTLAEIEDYVIQKRTSDPVWGSLKLHKLICNDKEKGLYTYESLPCRSAINKILKRNGLIDPNLSKSI